MSIDNITSTDPLANAIGERERELFRQLSGICGRGGYTPQQVAEAALNLVCNAIRQSFPTRGQAERQFDELVGKMKGVLLEQHYDAVTGKRRHNFAWDQRIEMPLSNFRDQHH